MIFHNDIDMYRTSLQLDKSPYNSVHTVKYLSGVFEAAQNKTLVVCHSSKSDAMSSLIRRIQNKCDNVWSLGFTPTKQAIWRFHLGNGNISQFPHTQRFTEKILKRFWILKILALTNTFVPAHTHPERVLVEIWRLSLHHLYGHDPERPNVHFGSVGLPGHNLWSHPVRSPHHGAAFTLLWGDLGTEAEVSCKERKKKSV